jgi:hypothetical protein
MERCQDDRRPVHLTTANLHKLQAQLQTAQTNDNMQEQRRKDVYRIQRAGYNMGFSLSSSVLQTPTFTVCEWVEDLSI